MLISSTTKAKSSFTDLWFIATSLVLVAILFIRVTRGLDLTDEMQYYGEIKGLIETGKLFSNDLFIQQVVYVLIYPAFYIYHWIFGFEGFVFFGRLLMAVLSVAVFLYAYRKLQDLKFSFFVASLSALTLTFAIPYHGVFAPSYNTISQALWIVFIIVFFEWKQSNAILFSALPVVMAFAHPTSAVTIFLLVLCRFISEHDGRRTVNWLLVLLSGTLISVPVIFYFAPLQEYIASLAFSSGYGVGTAFFASKSQPISLLVIFAMFAFCSFLPPWIHKSRLALFTGLCIAVALALFIAGLTGGAYSPRGVYVLALLSALAYGWSLANISTGEKSSRRRIYWLALALLAYMTTLGVTSGNGLGQSTGALMVGLPLLLGVAVSSAQRNQSSNRCGYVEMACVVLVFALFAAHWSRYPYREDSWWNANQAIHSVSEFRFISSSSERINFIERMQATLQPVKKDQRTLIIGEYPGLYLALNVRPETCMLYMHSLTSQKSEEALLNCLRKKQPEIVIDIHANNDIADKNSRIKSVMHTFVSGRGLTCSVTLIESPSITKHNPKHLDLAVCT